jgi:hypothetical protein
MCLQTETIDELHTVASAMKTAHADRERWLSDTADGLGAAGITYALHVTRAEAERIFADRIAFHEARLKELGWSRTVRVESQAAAA